MHIYLSLKRRKTIVYIKTTQSCNLSCKHCYVGQHRSKSEVFDQIQTVKWLKAYCQEFGIDQSQLYIRFHGGQPFLCGLDKIKHVCESFKSSVKSCTTNLILLNDQIIQLVKEHFFDPEIGSWYIKTSWDKDIRFSQQELKLWELNIKRLLSEKIQFTVIVCLTKLLVDGMAPKDLWAYFKDLGVKSIDFQRLTLSTTSDKSLIPDYDHQDDWLYGLFQIWSKEQKSIQVGMLDQLSFATKRVFLNCRHRTCMKDVLTINADGSVGACPNTALSSPFTTIFESPSKISESKIFKDQIELEKNPRPQCIKCDLFYWCNGDCCQQQFVGGRCSMPKRALKQMLESAHSFDLLY